MDTYKKEKSSKQHMKIDVGQNQPQDEVFTLANPMTYGDVTTPTSPPSQSTSSSGHAVSNPPTPTNAHSTGFSRTFERLSLKSKTRNQSFFKFFGRGHEKPSSHVTNGGGVSERNEIGAGGKQASMNDEDFGGDGSSGSDHEDPFSPHSSGSSGDMLRAHRQLSEPPKSPSSTIETQPGQPGQPRRHHSGGHHSRDSGFSSERESVSHVRITPQTSLNAEEDRGSPSDEVEYQPAGMEALEILHNQLQLLVKRDTDEDTDSVDVYEQIINRLSRQLEEQNTAMDMFRQTETNLRLALRLAEQRTIEAETEKAIIQERCLRVEQKYSKLSLKYKALKGGCEEAGSVQPHHSKSPGANPSPRHSVQQYPPSGHPNTSTAAPVNGPSSQTQTRSPPQTQTRSTPQAQAPQTQARSPPQAQAPQTQARSPPQTQAPQTQTRSPPQTQAPQTQTRSPPQTQAPQTQTRSPPQTQTRLPPQTQVRSPPQRVQSQTLYDRKQKMMEPNLVPCGRPSTAQGFHNDQGDIEALGSLASLSHTETCV